MDWSIPIAAALAPIVGRGVYWLIKKDKENEERRIAEYEAEQVVKRQLKAEKKAAKLAAKQRTHYTSASVVPPARLGFDGSDGGAGGAPERDASGSGEPR